MTDRELILADKILKKNHINASPTAFWDNEKYYDIAYMTPDGSTFRKIFLKNKNR